MPKILLVEDDTSLANSVQETLHGLQHSVDVVNDGTSALDYLQAMDYDLIVLDWHIPEVSGIEVCQRYRKNGGQAHVLMLTGRDGVADKEQGLDSGADDYLTKPFEMREFLARVRALLRRPSRYDGDLLKAGALSLDVRSQRVTVNGKPMILRARELAVLHFFMRHTNQVVSAETLLSRVWGTDTDASLDAVYTCLNRLRKKLNADDKEAVIRTVYGSGYILQSDE